MRVRVTLARTVQQFVDVTVANAESEEDARDQVTADLAQPAKRARLLHDAKWIIGDILVKDIEVLESTAKE